MEGRKKQKWGELRGTREGEVKRCAKPMSTLNNGLTNVKPSSSYRCQILIVEFNVCILHFFQANCIAFGANWGGLLIER